MQETIASYQDAASIPLLIGVDEEGGTVARVSANPNFRAERFSSPQQLYAQGGLEAIVADTVEKDALLQGLGINVNFAPVADLSTNPEDFIYPRTLGRDAWETADYIFRVVSQMEAYGSASPLSGLNSRLEGEKILCPKLLQGPLIQGRAGVGVHIGAIAGEVF